MDSFLGWLLNVGASAAGSAALLLWAGHLFRSQLTHWLTKDLEDLKAKHQRDLEAYKVSLIAEAERAKASQDVRKAMAIKIAERKFGAIDALHEATAPLAAKVIAALRVHRSSTFQIRLDEVDKLSSLVLAGSAAASLASPHLNQAERMIVHGFCARLSEVLQTLHESDSVPTLQDIESYASDLIQRQQDCNTVIQMHLERMLSMA